jgi:hypothetical protein
MTRLIPGKGKEFFENKSKRLSAEYDKYCIDIGKFEQDSSSEKLKEAKKFNMRLWKELDV